MMNHFNTNRYIEYLMEIGANEINHHGRTLLDHLKGTCDLLSEWGNDELVVMAGLMHSIYGTEEFKHKTLSLEHRPEIARIIGDEAEELVYLFCSANRRELFTQKNAEPFHVIIPSVDNSLFNISEAQYRSLIEIEVANIVEQALHQKGVADSVVLFWLNAFDAKVQFMSKKASESYVSILSNYTANYTA